jgi:hypothetical protein
VCRGLRGLLVLALGFVLLMAAGFFDVGLTGI